MRAGRGDPRRPEPRRGRIILIFPRLDACRTLAGARSGHADPNRVLREAPIREFFQQLVDDLWASGTGSATRVARAIVLAEPPSIDRGEVTDKGSINQRAVLHASPRLGGSALYADDDPRRHHSAALN